MPTPFAAEARLAELYDYYRAKFDNNENDAAFAILKESGLHARGRESSIPIASPAVRLALWRQLYDRARQFNQTKFALKVMREIRKEEAL